MQFKLKLMVDIVIVITLNLKKIIESLENFIRQYDKYINRWKEVLGNISFFVTKRNIMNILLLWYKVWI